MEAVCWMREIKIETLDVRDPTLPNPAFTLNGPSITFFS